MKKKLVTAVMALCACIGGLGAAGMAATDVMAQTGNQNPVISGTSTIQVLKDEAFQKNDVLNRVYAMDYEDGDLTGDIKVVSDNVNTAKTGTYSVVYEVTDSEGGTGTFTTEVQVVDALDTDGQKIQKTLYSKENADHLLAVELYRGFYHDRQHLGVYLNEGTSLKVRIVNWQEVWSYMTLDLLGDDSAVEKTYSIPYDGSWLTIPAEDVTEDLVPFIRTLESNVQPILEYYYVEDTMDELTYYWYGDEQEAFFDNWKNNGQDYAVVEGERITMLIPTRDMDYVLNNSTTREEYQFKTLDEMLTYFKDVQDQYDEFAGLVYDQDAGTDKNVRVKYFAKADATGVGAAYYSASLYTAENSESMKGYLKRDWMTLHEIAHGYDTSIAYGDLPLVETINNMLGYFYEKKMLADGDYGWSYLQYFELVEDTYMNQLAEGKTFASMDFDARLYCMLNVLRAADPQEMMSELHKAWRKDGGKTNTVDFIVEQFSKTSGYNLVPYFEEYGIYTSELVKDRIYEMNYPVATRFAYYFENTASAKTAGNQMKDTISGVYSLVGSDAVAALNMTGDLQIQIEIDDIELVKGKEVRILDGETVVASAEITDEGLFFENLPAGVYQVELPAVRKAGYYADYVCVTIAENTTLGIDAVYQLCGGNAMKDDSVIVLQGLSDQVFASIATNIDNEEITITTEARMPHYYFSDAYATIEICDPDGEVLYSRDYIGNTTYTYEQETVYAQVGSVIRIYHTEVNAGLSGRVQVKSNLLSTICEEHMENYTSEDSVVSFEVTADGLKRVDWTEKNFTSARSALADEILALLKQEEGTQTNRDNFQKVKAMLYGLISSFDEKTQETYKTAYPYLFEDEEVPVEPTPTPTPTPGNPFEDVEEKDYFYYPVLWAVEKGITKGLTETMFAPDMTCTRAEVVTFLWRANGRPEPTSSENPFEDVSSDTYYHKAILWAVEKGITKGLTETMFAPNATVTRGQFASFLWRAEGRPTYTVENPFSDLADDSYYYDAILWAYENQVTAGYYQDLFAPDLGCSRCQVVSFLYRAR